MQKILTGISGDVTIKKIIDRLTYNDLMAELRDFYEKHATKYLIWVIAEGTLTELTSEDLNVVAHFVKSQAHTRVGGKTAFVAPGNLEFGICRMLDTFGELKHISFETRTFRDLSEAAKWIGVDELPAID